MTGGIKIGIIGGTGLNNVNIIRNKDDNNTIILTNRSKSLSFKSHSENSMDNNDFSNLFTHNHNQ